MRKTRPSALGSFTTTLAGHDAPPSIVTRRIRLSWPTPAPRSWTSTPRTATAPALPCESVACIHSGVIDAGSSTILRVTARRSLPA